MENSIKIEKTRAAVEGKKLFSIPVAAIVRYDENSSGWSERECYGPVMVYQPEPHCKRLAIYILNRMALDNIKIVITDPASIHLDGTTLMFRTNCQNRALFAIVGTTTDMTALTNFIQTFFRTTKTPSPTSREIAKSKEEAQYHLKDILLGKPPAAVDTEERTNANIATIKKPSLVPASVYRKSLTATCLKQEPNCKRSECANEIPSAVPPSSESVQGLMEPSSFPHFPLFPPGYPGFTPHPAIAIPAPPPLELINRFFFSKDPKVLAVLDLIQWGYIAGCRRAQKYPQDAPSEDEWRKRFNISSREAFILLSNLAKANVCSFPSTDSRDD